MLKYGYSLPFAVAPGSYEERNNATVRRSPSVVAGLVAELQAQGVIQYVSHKPTCVNPLGLVTKVVSGEVKHRLVLDVSRWVNTFIDPAKVKLAHLEKALEITQQNDFQTVFDLQSAYHQIKIAPDHVQYLGAAVEMEGKHQYFVFLYLPFGLNSAVHVITKMWKPLTAFLHIHGIRFSIYIDDGRILTRSALDAEAARRFVYEVVRKAGWLIAESKSDGVGDSDRVKKYLGFTIDSKSMTVHCPDEKWQHLQAPLVELFEQQSFPVKVLARSVGQIIALSPSHGPIVQICTRSSFELIQAHVNAYGWAGSLQWSQPALAELRFFLSEGPSFNGAGIPHHSRDVAIHTDLLVSDSSNIKAAVKWLEGACENSVTTFSFSEQEAKTSSGERELLALYKLVSLPGVSHSFQGAHIMWLTDSTNFVAFVSKGSSKPAIQQKIFKIFASLTELGCRLTAIHVRRTDERIQQVDHLSKVLDTDNWSIDEASFAALHAAFHFDIDLFADSSNRRVTQFVSKFFHETALAVDAFSVPWDGMLWVCPPTYLIPRVVKRIVHTSCKGLLIIPNWPASGFYCLFFQHGQVLPPFQLVAEFSPYITQNEGARNTPLRGQTAFTFFALYFNTM